MAHPSNHGDMLNKTQLIEIFDHEIILNYTSGTRKVLEWYLNGTRMVLKWYSNGTRMVLEWHSNGTQMGNRT